MERRITYPRKMRNESSREGKALITLECTHPNGKPFLSMQGTATPEEVVEVRDLIAKFLKHRK